MTILELDSVTAAYNTTPILRDVDLSVDRGEIVGVMGKNGVGKTTLMETIIGLLEPTHGTITYAGQEITDISADKCARAGMGYIPQGRDVFPQLSVEQNIQMGETINANSSVTLYDQIYDYFPILQERADQQAGTLSGGQQQMLAIARALVSNPDLLLLDEPSEGIQPSIVDQISSDMQSINAELGTTILFVEQNLGVIRELADRCYAMERGEIVDEFGEATLSEEDGIMEYLAV